MILVTLGTQKQQFTRLIDYVNELETKEDIIVQAGYTKYKSDKMKILDFIDYDEMNKYESQADIVITHAGTGSIIGPLKKGKIVIACPRRKEFKEHVDNHQEQIVEVFESEGYILRLDETKDLNKIIKNISKFKPKKFISNTSNFIEKLENKISED